MDYLILQEYAVTYGLHAIVLSLLICLVRFILKTFLKEKINEVTRSYIEIAFAILSEFIYSLIVFGDARVLTFKSVSSALLSYSLSLIIYSLIRRIVKGKTIKVDTKTLVIEELLSPYAKEEEVSKLSKTIAKEIDKGLDEKGLLSLLSDKLSRPEEDEEIIALVHLIFSSLNKI